MKPFRLGEPPLTRAADYLGTTQLLKTAKELRAPHVAEVHIVGGNGEECILGELFKACGWLVIYEPNKKLEKSSRRGLQPRRPRKPKGA